MAVPVVEIHNVSNQRILIAYEAGDVNNAAGDVAATKSGTLGIPEGNQVTIEEQRVDLGQLENLRAQNLISFTRSQAS